MLFYLKKTTIHTTKFLEKIIIMPMFPMEMAILSVL